MLPLKQWEYFCGYQPWVADKTRFEQEKHSNGKNICKLINCCRVAAIGSWMWDVSHMNMNMGPKFKPFPTPLSQLIMARIYGTYQPSTFKILRKSWFLVNMSCNRCSPLSQPTAKIPPDPPWMPWRAGGDPSHNSNPGMSQGSPCVWKNVRGYWKWPSRNSDFAH